MSNFNLTKINNKKMAVLFLIVLVFLLIHYFVNRDSNAYFTKGPNMNYDRYISSSIALNNGDIFILGWNGIAKSENIANKPEKYNIHDNIFEKLPDTNYEHLGITYLFAIRNKILLLDNNPLEYYLIDKNKFIKTDLCILEDKCKERKTYGKYTLFTPYLYNADKFLIYSNYTPMQLYFWNYITGDKTKLPKFNINRKDYGILVLNNGRIIIAGGCNDKGKYLDNAEIYNPISNKFDIIENFKLDSAIVQQLSPNGKTFRTNEYEYSFNEKQNIFIKRRYANESSKKYKVLKLDDNLEMFIYDNCLLFCSARANLYLKDENKRFDGVKMLYGADSLSNVVRLGNGKYLIYGGNYLKKNTHPTRHTQMLNIRKLK